MGVELETIIPLTMARLKFGVGATEELGYELKSLGARKVLLVTDKGLWDHGLIDKVKGIIEGEKIALRIFDEVRCEPTDRSMREAIAATAGAEFDAVVGLGGGSALDTAKAVNLYGTHPADLLEYVNAPIGKGKPVPGPLKPLIALPTTAGTGSETTTVIVMDFLDLHVKTGISHQHIRPTVALVDPLNSLSAPAAVTAYTGLDVLTHAAESFTIKPYNMRPKAKDPAARPPTSDPTRSPISGARRPSSGSEPTCGGLITTTSTWKRRATWPWRPPSPGSASGTRACTSPTRWGIRSPGWSRGGSLPGTRRRNRWSPTDCRWR